MDHDDVLEQLELAAVEPGGLDRLMAGDTATAGAVAGHLAGCESCAGELERLRRSVPLLRDVVRTTPPPDLRERTLAFVAARGVVRGAPVASVVQDPADAAADEPVLAPVIPLAAPVAARARPSWPWIAAIAAAVVISVVATTALLSIRSDERVASQDRVIAGLGNVITSTLAIAGEPDATRVALASTDGSGAQGSLLFAPSTGQLVVVADGLAPEPDGQEYWCWVEVDGQRQPVGRMYLAQGLGYWAGESEVMTQVSAGATFGVSLSRDPGSGVQPAPVLVGEL